MQISNSYIDLPKKIKLSLQNANIFFSESYERNSIERGQHLLYLWSEYHVLVARIKQKFFLKAAVLESEPFVLKEGEDEKDFLNVAMMGLKNQGIQWAVVANTARFQTYPSSCYVVPCGNHIVDLTLSKEELWAKVNSKHRNSIRRGEKVGIEIISGGIELVKDFAPLANMTYSRSGKSDAGESYYQSLMKNLENNAIIMLACKDKELHSAGMFYYNNEMAYYLHGASIARPEPGATNFLLWKAMLHFKNLGVKSYSFVGYHYNPEPGSKLDGIQRFKERFGGELEKSYNFRCEFNKLAYRVFCFVMQLKARRLFEKYQDPIDKQIHNYADLNKG